jgi:hypothetical protein
MKIATTGTHRPITLILDTSAEASILKKSTLKSCEKLRIDKGISISGITKNIIQSEGYIKNYLIRKNYNIEENFYIINDDGCNFGADGIIGLPFFRIFQKFTCEPEHKSMTLETYNLTFVFDIFKYESVEQSFSQKIENPIKNLLTNEKINTNKKLNLRKLRQTKVKIAKKIIDKKIDELKHNSSWKIIIKNDIFSRKGKEKLVYMKENYSVPKIKNLLKIYKKYFETHKNIDKNIQGQEEKFKENVLSMSPFIGAIEHYKELLKTSPYFGAIDYKNLLKMSPLIGAINCEELSPLVGAINCEKLSPLVGAINCEKLSPLVGANNYENDNIIEKEIEEFKNFEPEVNENIIVRKSNEANLLQNCNYYDYIKAHRKQKSNTIFQHSKEFIRNIFSIAYGMKKDLPFILSNSNGLKIFNSVRPPEKITKTLSNVHKKSTINEKGKISSKLESVTLENFDNHKILNKTNKNIANVRLQTLNIEPLSVCKSYNCRKIMQNIISLLLLLSIKQNNLLFRVQLTF